MRAFEKVTGLENIIPLSPEARSRIIAEFNYLKVAGLFLLIFVHSDLIIVYPSIIYPVQWFLLSSFLFISGYLSFYSFHRREESFRRFFKSKVKSLFVPFFVAVFGYYGLQISTGVAKFDPFYLVSQLSFLNMFDFFNVRYNWVFLWFIPYLLVFMLVFCILEKYVKDPKMQVALTSLIWVSTMLLWVFDSPFKLGQLFSQFVLVFMFGFWVNKFGVYEKIMSYKTAFVTIPLAVFFSFDLSGMFSFDSQIASLEALLYSNGRIILLTLSSVLLALLFLRKIRIPKNGFVKYVASRSAFIYLSEPFVSFLILSLVFWRTEVYFADGAFFWIYQTVRVAVMLVLLPFMYRAIKTFYKNKTSAKSIVKPL